MKASSFTISRLRDASSPAVYASRRALPHAMQDSLPAGGLRLCRAGVEPAESLREVSGHRILLSRASPGAISVRSGRGMGSVNNAGCAIVLRMAVLDEDFGTDLTLANGGVRSSPVSVPERAPRDWRSQLSGNGRGRTRPSATLGGAVRRGTLRRSRPEDGAATRSAQACGSGDPESGAGGQPASFDAGRHLSPSLPGFERSAHLPR